MNNKELIKKLRRKLGSSPYLPIYIKLFEATNGFTKEGAILLVQGELDKLLAACERAKGFIDPARAIMATLGLLYENDQYAITSHAVAFQKATGLTINIKDNGRLIKLVQIK